MKNHDKVFNNQPTLENPVDNQENGHEQTHWEEKYKNVTALGLSSLVLEATNPAAKMDIIRDIAASCVENLRLHDNKKSFKHIVSDEHLGSQLAALEARIAGGEQPPLAGVVMGVKDLEDVIGMPTTMGGSDALYTAKESSLQVQRLIDAGVIIVGKTNCPEFGIMTHTPGTENAHSTTRTPGGSSGGSAVAVAEGLVPACTASDGGGSIRIPASYAGLTGFKMSADRAALMTNPSSSPEQVESANSRDLLGAENWYGQAVLGCITQSIEDTLFINDIMCGIDIAHPSSLASVAARAKVLRRGVSPEKVVAQNEETTVAIMNRKVFGKIADPTKLDNLDQVKIELQSLGFKTVDAVPFPDDINFGEARDAALLLVMAGTAEEVNTALKKAEQWGGGTADLSRGDKIFSKAVQVVHEVGANFTSDEINNAINIVTKFRSQIDDYFANNGYSLLMDGSPSSSAPLTADLEAVRKTQEITSGLLPSIATKIAKVRKLVIAIARSDYAEGNSIPAWNFLGYAAATLPAGYEMLRKGGKSDTELLEPIPVGVHLMGGKGFEGDLALARLLFQVAF